MADALYGSQFTRRVRLPSNLLKPDLANEVSVLEP
jgi:hypothetical protein